MYIQEKEREREREGGGGMEDGDFTGCATNMHKCTYNVHVHCTHKLTEAGLQKVHAISNALWRSSDPR